MDSQFLLESLPTESLDAVLAMDMESKIAYFSTLAKSFYPDIEDASKEFVDIVELYISSFYLEKIYRSNRFFNEKFTPIYTTTGLIRDVVADLFYSDKDLIVH